MTRIQRANPRLLRQYDVGDSTKKRGDVGDLLQLPHGTTPRVVDATDRERPRAFLPLST